MFRRLVAAKRPASQVEGNDVDQSEKKNWMSRFLVKCALLATAIAAVAAMIGLDMRAIIILIPLGLVILVLASGGSPGPNAFWGGPGSWGGPASSSPGHHNSGQSSNDCGSAGGGSELGPFRLLAKLV